MRQQQLAAAVGALVELEREVAQAAKNIDSSLEPRVYEWHPVGLPELPAIWNWIDDGSYTIVDTARANDVLVMSVTIGVLPTDTQESMRRLLRIADVFREVVDPALWNKGPDRNPSGPLEGTVLYAKRVVTRSEIVDFDGTPVMCLTMLIRLDLQAFIGG